MVGAKCFDVTTMVIDEATKRFANSGFYENELAKHSIKDACSAIDIFVMENDVLSYEVWVDDETTDITISVLCEDIEIFGVINSFFDVIKRTKSFWFKPYNEDSVQLNFIFNGIWSLLGKEA